jgi:hypothetical protein
MENRIKIHQHSSLGMFWCIGWLFTIGFLKLSFFRGFLAIVIWPYYIGAHFADEVPLRPAPVLYEEVQL